MTYTIEILSLSNPEISYRATCNWSSC